eukprot:COSAG02_NODE_2098_length_9831_cov_17.592581_10_plen_83_part_00
MRLGISPNGTTVRLINHHQKCGLLQLRAAKIGRELGTTPRTPQAVRAAQPMALNVLATPRWVTTTNFPVKSPALAGVDGEQL